MRHIIKTKNAAHAHRKRKHTCANVQNAKQNKQPSQWTSPLTQIVKHNIKLMHPCVQAIHYMPCAKVLSTHNH